MTARALPESIAPMLARTGRPFDSDDHLFEIKWDGIRAIAFVEGGRRRVANRRCVEVTASYPELTALDSLPDGTALDGEIVVLRDGKPDFELMQSRWNVKDPRSAAVLARRHPATFVAFDLLFLEAEPCFDRPLAERRERLGEILTGSPAGIVFSEGVTGAGVAFFTEAGRQGLEGVIAKRLDSAYRPGRRSDAWLKIKCRRTIQCVVIGYLPSGADDFRSLLVAAPDAEDTLRYVGRVGTGFTDLVRARLFRLLRESPREAPVVPCDESGRWVEPEIFCEVGYLEMTRAGHLRAPVFGGILEP